MRIGRWLRCLTCASLLGCASAPPPPPAPPPQAAEAPADRPPPPRPQPEPAVETTASEAAPPTNASFEEATSTPEPIDVHDGRAQLTDSQLTGPMRGVLDRCHVPANVRVTIRTAVQNGVAIGVTVEVELPQPKTPPPSAAKKKRRLTKAQARALAKAAARRAKAEAKTKERIVTCADRAVRSRTWPPSSRRDTFTTVF